MCCLSKTINYVIFTSMIVFIGLLLLVIYGKCIEFPKNIFNNYKCDDFGERVLDLFRFI